MCSIHGAAPPVGEVAFHGIPFRIGGGEHRAPFVLLEPGARRRGRSGRAASPIASSSRTAGFGRRCGARTAARGGRGRRTRSTSPTVRRTESRSASASRSRPRPMTDGTAAARSLPRGAMSSASGSAPGRWEELGMRQTEVGTSSRAAGLLPLGLGEPEPEASRSRRSSSIATVRVGPRRRDHDLGTRRTIRSRGGRPDRAALGRPVRTRPLAEPVVEVDRGVAGYAFALPAGRAGVPRRPAARLRGGR